MPPYSSGLLVCVMKAECPNQSDGFCPDLGTLIREGFRGLCREDDDTITLHLATHLEVDGDRQSISILGVDLGLEKYRNTDN